MDAANLLKPMLARGELRMIGATTLAEYRKIERDGALARRFSAVTVEEPVGRGDRRRSCAGLRAAYEEHHGAGSPTTRSTAAARLSDRYVTEYHLPDKAIDLVDQAAARVRLRTQAASTRRRRPRARATSRSPRPRRRGRRGARTSSAPASSRRRPTSSRRELAELEARAEAQRAGRRGDPTSTSRRSPRSSPPARASRSGSWWPASSSGSAGAGGRPAPAGDRPGRGRRAGRRHGPPRARRPVRGRPPARHVPVPRPDRRRQDRAGQGAGRAAVRDRDGRSSASTCPSTASRTPSRG